MINANNLSATVKNIEILNEEEVNPFDIYFKNLPHTPKNKSPEEEKTLEQSQQSQQLQNQQIPQITVSPGGFVTIGGPSGKSQTFKSDTLLTKSGDVSSRAIARMLNTAKNSGINITPEQVIRDLESQNYNIQGIPQQGSFGFAQSLQALVQQIKREEQREKKQNPSLFKYMKPSFPSAPKSIPLYTKPVSPAVSVPNVVLLPNHPSFQQQLPGSQPHSGWRNDPHVMKLLRDSGLGKVAVKNYENIIRLVASIGNMGYIVSPNELNDFFKNYYGSKSQPSFIPPLQNWRIDPRVIDLLKTYNFGTLIPDAHNMNIIVNIIHEYGYPHVTFAEVESEFYHARGGGSLSNVQSSHDLWYEHPEVKKILVGLGYGYVKYPVKSPFSLDHIVQHINSFGYSITQSDFLKLFELGYDEPILSDKTFFQTLKDMFHIGARKKAQPLYGQPDLYSQSLDQYQRIAFMQNKTEGVIASGFEWLFRHLMASKTLRPFIKTFIRTDKKRIIYIIKQELEAIGDTNKFGMTKQELISYIESKIDEIEIVLNNYKDETEDALHRKIEELILSMKSHYNKEFHQIQLQAAAQRKTALANIEAQKQRALGNLSIQQGEYQSSLLHSKNLLKELPKISQKTKAQRLQGLAADISQKLGKNIDYAFK